MPDIDIIIPVLNEQDSIKELVRRIDKAFSKAKIKYRIVFVDDRSTDDTIKRIKSLQSKYPIILHEKVGLQGKAYAILEGVEKSSANVLAMIDGDLQYPPEALPEMYELSKKHAVVVANRRKEAISAIRRIGSDASSRIIGKLLLGLTCDAQSGMKVFWREVIEEVDPKDVKPWALDMPLLHKALEMGNSIGAVEIDFQKRSKGSSKVKFVKTAFEITSTALKLKLRKSKTLRIKPKGETMMGAGVAHKRKKFITHTTLPHEHSALTTLSAWQKAFFFSLALLLIAGLSINYLATLIVIVAVLSFIYFADVLFSGYVLLKSLHFPPELKFDDKEISSLNESKLPVYTILCPLYKEGKVLPDFIDSVKEIDWPKNKLEVLILLEEDDNETLEVSKNIDLPSFVKVVVVPDSQPRTKPKACNYGLHIATGEYVVIYDAEDKPDPLQLKKAYLGFKKLGDKYFCLQSKLNYFNPNDNILTRLFTAEYSLWFDVILPGLQSIESSIPLGGTSNHFRVKKLIEIHAWDPFNVTEDCDLGVRIFKAGYKTAIIDSTTLEEANSSPRNWIRQRSRWIKGYMQTYLVHMRNPIEFFKTHGIHAVIFQLIIGMRMTFMLINPFLWVMTILYFALRSTVGVAIEALYPAPVFYTAAFALVVGNFMYIFNYMIGSAKRGHYGLIKFVFLIPVYWVMASIAAVKALNQLIFKPHFWEKTHHGLHLPSVSIPASIEQKKASVGTAPLPFNKLRSLLNPNVSSGILLISAAMISNVFNFLTSTYLGRTLRAEEFGLIALMTSFLFIVQLPSNGISQTVSHQTAFLLGKYGQPSGIFWSKHRSKIFATSIFLSLIWCLLTPISTDIFNSHTVIPFLVFSPVWIFVILGSVDSGYLQGGLRFRSLAILTLLGSIFKLFFSFLFIYLGLNDWVYVALPLSLLITCIVGWLLAKRTASNSNVNENIANSLRFPKKFFATSVVADLSVISFLSLDLIFAKHYLSAVEAGQYALLVLVGRMVYMVGGLSSQFILPLISKEEGAGKHDSQTFLRLLSLVFLSTFSVFLVVGPAGNFTVPLLFGEKAYPIIPYLTPFAFSMILFSVSYSLVAYHQAKREYFFVIPGVLTSFFLFTSFYFFHASIFQVVMGMLVSSVFFLLSSIAFHIFESRVKVFFSNLQDLLDLFYFKINGKHPLPDGNLRILVYNWRDTKHVWAGGAEVYVHELSKRWIADGHKVTLFCGNDGKSKRNEEIDGVKIIRRGGFYTVYLWAFLYYLMHFRRRYDVIIESENGVPFFTPLYSTKPKILIVHHVHQEVFRKHLKFPLSFIASFVESRLMPLVYRGKTIVAVSESTKKEIAQLNIAKEEDIYVVSPGVDTNFFAKSKKTEYPSFIYLGRHKPYKNIDVAIKAFSKVIKKYPAAKLIIAGEGETTESLKRLSNKLGIRKSVYFTGKVSEAEKLKLLAKSWVALQPSSFEGWGITVIEANATGTPVIAARVSGLIDSVIDGRTGLLVPAKEVASLSAAMIKTIEDKELRTRMSGEAYKWSKNHDWHGRSQSLSAIITKLVVNKKRPVLSPEVVTN